MVFLTEYTSPVGTPRNVLSPVPIGFNDYGPTPIDQPRRIHIQLTGIFGAEAYSNLLGLEETLSNQEIKEKCRKALSDVGATDQYVEFFAEVLQFEFEINSALSKLHQSMGVDKLDGVGENPEKLLRVTQELTRNFNHWKNVLESLHSRSQLLPPLHLDPDKFNTSTVLKALCSLQTDNVAMEEGDEIIITDTSQPNKLKIRNKSGQEGYVPALSCVLPSPDKNALTATERLRIQLLASWVESTKKVRRFLMECLLSTSKLLANNWKTRINENGALVATDRVTRRFKRLSDTITKQAPRWDLQKLHHALFSLEKELDSTNGNGAGTDVGDIRDMVERIAALDKSVLCYQMLTKQLHLFRHSLEIGARPIRIVDHMGQFSPQIKGRQFKYFEVKWTVEEIETVEETTRIPPPRLSVCPRNPISHHSSEYGVGHRNETIQADQITSSSLEEKRKFIIRGVVDPRSNMIISIQDAIEKLIVNQESGLYVNPATGVGMPIQEAMNLGHIKVEQTTCTKTKEETKAIGLVTIKTSVDNRAYSVTGVVHPLTGFRITLDEAQVAGLIDDTQTTFTVADTGETMTLEEAIQEGHVLVEYDPEPEEVEYDTKIFAVNAVVDQKQKKKVPFYEAVERGLIDRETGTYINNVTGEAIYVVEAIQRGFLKAKVIDASDAIGLDIDAENRMVIDRMEKIRKNILKPIGIINAFKKAALGAPSHGDSPRHSAILGVDKFQ